MSLFHNIKIIYVEFFVYLVFHKKLSEFFTRSTSSQNLKPRGHVVINYAFNFVLLLNTYIRKFKTLTTRKSNTDYFVGYADLYADIFLFFGKHLFFVFKNYKIEKISAIFIDLIFGEIILVSKKADNNLI